MERKPMDIRDIKSSPVQLINDEWMLVTAGGEGGYNTMTASWGGIGELWNRNVAFVFVRPSRYTYEFLEKNDRFTLSFFGGNFKKELRVCGSKSGRDIDKAAETGLIPVFDGDVTYFDQANLVLICRKLAIQDIDPAGFLDPAIEGNYGGENYHRMYVAEIEQVLSAQ